MSDLKAFDVLVGTWHTEATHPQVDGVVPGRVAEERFEQRFEPAQAPARGGATYRRVLETPS